MPSIDMRRSGRAAFWINTLLVLAVAGCQAAPIGGPPTATPPGPTATAPASTATPGPAASTAPAITPLPVPGTPAPSPASTPTQAPSLSPAVAIASPYPHTVVVPGGSNFPVIAAGSVWVPRMNEGDLVRADLETNEILASIQVSRNRPMRGPHAIAARGDEVWINAHDDEGWALLRIDPQTNEVAQRITVGVPGFDMAIEGDNLWMTSFENGRVIHVDLASGEVISELRTIPNALGIAIGDDALWVGTAGQWNVARVDRQTNAYSLISTATRANNMVAVVGDEVWVTTADSAQVLVIDPAASRIVERIELQFPLGLVEHDGLVWITEHSANGSPVANERLVAVDAATREVVREIPMSGLGMDRGIAAHGDSLWVVADAGLIRLER